MKRASAKKPYPCHTSPPARHRRAGATKASDYADPVCFKYPLKGKTPAETKALVRNAAARFAQSGDLYPPARRAEVRSAIDRAEKKNGIGPYHVPSESRPMTKKRKPSHHGSKKRRNPTPKASSSRGGSKTAKRRNPTEAQTRAASEPRKANGEFKKGGKKRATKRTSTSSDVHEVVRAANANVAEVRREAKAATTMAHKAVTEATAATREAHKALTEAKKAPKARKASSGRKKSASARAATEPRAASGRFKKGGGHKAKRSRSSSRPARHAGESNESYKSRCSRAGEALRACATGGTMTTKKRKPAKKAKKRNPTALAANPTHRAGHHKKAHHAKGRKKAKRRNPTEMSASTSRTKKGQAWHAHMRNPTNTWTDAAIFAVTVAVFYSMAEVTDKVLATRAANSVGTTVPAYGADAFARQLVRPSGIRLAVPGLIGVAGLGGAMALGMKHPLAASLLAGVGGGSAIFLAKVGIVDYMLPAILKAGNGSSSDTSWGNRLYPELQSGTQSNLSAMVSSETVIGALSANFPYITGVNTSAATTPPSTQSQIFSSMNGMPRANLFDGGVRGLPAREPMAMLPPAPMGVGGHQHQHVGVGCPGGCGGQALGAGLKCKGCSGNASEQGLAGILWPDGAAAYSASEDQFYNGAEQPMGVGKNGPKHAHQGVGALAAIAQNGSLGVGQAPAIPGMRPLTDPQDASRVIGYVSEQVAQRAEQGVHGVPSEAQDAPAPSHPLAAPPSSSDNVRPMFPSRPAARTAASSLRLS